MLPTPRICMSIEQEPDGLSGRNRRFSAAVANQFGNRRKGDVLSTTQLVTFTHDPRIFDIDGPLRVNLRPVIVISQDAAAIWVNAGVDCSAVNNRGAWKDRVMISKSDTAVRQFPERGCALFADEIGPHSIPDHDHHMFAPANRSLGGSILHRRSSAAD